MDAHRYGISISFSARLVPGAGEIFPFGLLTKAPSVWRVDLFSWKNKQLFCPILHCHWRFINESIFLSPLNDRDVTVSKFNWAFAWDSPHFVKARDIYLFTWLWERNACYVVLIWHSLSREDWIPKNFLHGGTAVISFLMQLFGFNFRELILNFIFVSRGLLFPRWEWVIFHFHVFFACFNLFI